MFVRHVLPLMLLIAASPAMSADKFDLACKGYKWTKLGGSGEAYDFRVRIDLTAQKWCDGDCKASQAIVSAGDKELVLVDDGTLNSRMETAREATFDRKKNSFHYKMFQSRPTEQYLEYQADCTVEPFTPFPG